MYRKSLPGRTAWPVVTTIAGALVASIVVTGCGHSPATPGTGIGTSSALNAAAGTKSTGASGVLDKASGSGACYQWPGVGSLNAAAFPLQQAASDTQIYGYGSDQANSDSMAVNVALTGLAGELTQLPDDWAQTIQDQVITPGYSGDPGQMSAAAGNARSLASDIGQLCYTPG